MKRMAMVAVLAVVGMARAEVDVNVWKGASSGGLWNDSSNWERPLSPTVPTVYDFSSLADGAVVTNNFVFSSTAEQLAIAGLRLGENQGRITLFGTPTSQTVVKSGTFLVPTGTTLVVALRHTTDPWKDFGSTLTLSGAGHIVFEGDTFRGTSWKYCFDKAEGMRVTLGSRSAFELCTFQFFSSSNPLALAQDVRLTLAADTQIAGLKGAWQNGGVTNFVDLGTHTLCLGHANVCESYEATTGTGILVFEGGGTYTLRAAPRNTGGLVVRNADVNLGRYYSEPSNPTTSMNGPVRVSSETVLDIANAGCLTAFCDQTIAALRGEGTWGSICLSTNHSGVANLTVGEASESGETVFNGRITGLGGVMKRGASTLVLTGANTYMGLTEVAEGALVLRRASDPADAPAVHFDFSEAENWGTSIDKAASLTERAGVARLVEGVAGCGRGALDFDLAAAELPYARFKLASGVAPVLGDNRRFTAMLWFRLRDGCRGDVGAQRYLFSYGNTWPTSERRWIRAYLSDSTNVNFSVGRYKYQSAPGHDDGTSFSVAVAEDALYDGRWHHLALTWADGNVLSGYLDGRLLKSVAVDGDLLLPSDSVYALSFPDSATRFDGSMDEVKLFRRALTAEEIKDEQARRRRVREVGAGLPAPVARWDFNEAEAPLRDSSGNGYDLTTAIGTPSSESVYVGTFGRALAEGTGVKIAASEFPALIPTGAAPFTVSCRYKYVNTWNNSPLVVWGDPSRANAFFLLGTDRSSRRRPMINYDKAIEDSVGASCAYTNIVHVSAGDETAANWTHLICTYDGSTIRMYQDGSLAHAPLERVSLDIAADKLYIGCLPEANNAVFNGTIDDVRIYDCALSADQVRALTRALATETDPSVLPSDARVSVAAGATLGLEGTCPSFGSLACAGTLALGRTGAYRIGFADEISGALSGEGRLDVSGRDVAFSDGASFAGTLVATNARIHVANGLGPACVTLQAGAALTGAGRADVTLAEAAVIDVDVTTPNVPELQTTGELTLPERAVVRLSGTPSAGVLAIASAVRLRPPASFAGWSVVGADGKPFSGGRLRFRVRESMVEARVPGGLCVVVR